MSAYYNENNKHAAGWLRKLISKNLIAPGDVDERSITDVSPADLDGYAQHHFFAGIGGWSYALRLAGWPDDRPIVTGSCPCQPFSSSGRRKGLDDARHLWPAFRWLLAQRRPSKIVGEQVASSDGREWLAGVRADLEAMGYDVGAADLCAAGVGAPHIRQRLFWLADADSRGQEIAEGREEPRPDEVEGFIGNSRHSPWDGSEWHLFRDGVRRRTEPGLGLVVHVLPGRVGLVSGFGNAIVPQLAAKFIAAVMSGAKT